MSETPSFLLYPVTDQQFFEEYFEKKVLHIERDQAQYFDPIINLGDIDDHMATGKPHFPNINLRRSGGAKAHQPWLTFPSIGDKAPIDVDTVYKELAAGQTLILNAFQHKLPKLHKFLNEQGNSWSIRMSANVYVTPAGNQGFEWHYDNHDVLVLQIEGSKNWEILHEPPFLPDTNYKGHSTPPEQTDNAKTLTMQAGDVLYLPRGIYHKAIANNTSSVHITIGMYTKKVYDLLDDLMEQAQSEHELRKSWNVYGQTQEERAALVQKLKQFATNYFEQLNSNIPEAFDEQGMEKDGLDHGRLYSVLAMNRLSEDSWLKPIGNIECEIVGRFIQFSFKEKLFKYPVFMKAAVLSLLQEHPIQLGNIDGELPLKHRIELVRKFVTEGLLLIEKV